MGLTELTKALSELPVVRGLLQPVSVPPTTLTDDPLSLARSTASEIASLEFLIENFKAKPQKGKEREFAVSNIEDTHLTEEATQRFRETVVCLWGPGSGTGIRVTDTYVLTAAHVLYVRDDASLKCLPSQVRIATLMPFPHPRYEEGIFKYYHPDRVVFHPTADLALLHFNDLPPLKQQMLLSPDVSAKAYLIIPKNMWHSESSVEVRATGVIRNVFNKRFISSLKGTIDRDSGAPLINQYGDIIGIHSGEILFRYTNQQVGTYGSQGKAAVELLKMEYNNLKSCTTR